MCSDAREHLAAVIDQVRADHKPIYLARRGQRVAAVVDADDLDRILALAADMADIIEVAWARADLAATRETPVPWDEVKAELGLL